MEVFIGWIENGLERSKRNKRGIQLALGEEEETRVEHDQDGERHDIFNEQQRHTMPRTHRARSSMIVAAACCKE